MPLLPHALKARGKRPSWVAGRTPCRTKAWGAGRTNASVQKSVSGCSRIPAVPVLGERRALHSDITLGQRQRRSLCSYGGGNGSADDQHCGVSWQLSPAQAHPAFL